MPTVLSDRIATDLQKDGIAVIGRWDGAVEMAEFTLGELYDALDGIGIAHPRDVTIRGGRWDGAVEIVL